VKYSYNRITLLWHQRSICFMVVGGGGVMDAPGAIYTELLEFRQLVNFPHQKEI
jgi:hypothetical protein